VPAQFFLASSLLLDNRASEAADEFQRLLSHGESPYRAEALYYRAKALLRMGRSADASAELAKLTQDGGVTYDMGRALADSIARLAGR
jgi:TolA-binding protein